MPGWWLKVQNAGCPNVWKRQQPPQLERFTIAVAKSMSLNSDFVASKNGVEAVKVYRSHT
jgi:hypothetical protein